jgi:hypothetical protein
MKKEKKSIKRNMQSQARGAHVPRTWELRQEDWEFEASLNYIVSSRPA